MEITEGTKTIKRSRSKGTTSVRLNKMGYLDALSIQITFLKKFEKKIPLSVIIQKALSDYKEVIKKV